jgi:hypothetical protein
MHGDQGSDRVSGCIVITSFKMSGQVRKLNQNRYTHTHLWEWKRREVQPWEFSLSRSTTRVFGSFCRRSPPLPFPQAAFPAPGRDTTLFSIQWTLFQTVLRIKMPSSLLLILHLPPICANNFKASSIPKRNNYSKQQPSENASSHSVSSSRNASGSSKRLMRIKMMKSLLICASVIVS